MAFGRIRLRSQELRTLRLLLEGHSEKEVAAELGISVHTVHCYVKRIYSRFGVNTRAELLGIWIKELLKMVPATALMSVMPEFPRPSGRESVAVTERNVFASI